MLAFPNKLLPPTVPPAPAKRPLGVGDPDAMFVADAPPKRPPGFAAVVEAPEPPKRLPPG